MSATFEMPRLRTLARHALPKLLESTVIPVALFAGVLHFFGLWGAIIAGLGWSYAAILRRVVTRQRIPGLLLIGTLTLTARSVLAFATGSSVLYFLQPTLGTALVAVAFVLSVVLGRPLAQRIAADFCPIPPHVMADARVRRCFLGISLLWAVTCLVNASVSVWLQFTQSVGHLRDHEVAHPGNTHRGRRRHLGRLVQAIGEQAGAHPGSRARLRLASPRVTILVVDDDLDLVDVVRTALEREGFAVDDASDGATALDKIADDTPELVVLDLGLPKVRGLDVLRQVRADTAVPVIVLSGRSDEADRIIGLELGADDYVVKPFSPRELVARVRSVLRRSRTTGLPSTLSFPGLELDLANARGACARPRRRAAPPRVRPARVPVLVAAAGVHA